jgi:hypothetical protein
MTQAMAAPPPSAAALHGISLRIGEQVVPLSTPAARDLREAIEAANHRNRVEGLPDTLNPSIIDADKAARFVAALPAQPAETLERLSGHELAVDWSDLGLGAADPTRADAFSAPFRLIIDDVQGRQVIAHTTVPVDPALAKSRAADAKAAFDAAQADVTAMEAVHPMPTGASSARWRRSQAAFAWRLNAAAWAKSAPQDKQAATSLATAKAAVANYTMPSGGNAEP